jgi:hypothetical protein
MKWVTRLMASVAAVLVTAGGASALPQEPGSAAEAAWSAAVDADSIEAYAEFLMTYPDSKHTPEAYNRLNQVALSPAHGVPAQSTIAWSGGQSGRTSPEILPGSIMII